LPGFRHQHSKPVAKRLSSPASGLPDDNAIPAVESQYLAGRLRGQVPVRLLLANLISHAEADQPAHVTDVMRLAGFWGDLLER
jgi:hypothetical protein